MPPSHTPTGGGDAPGSDGPSAARIVAIVLLVAGLAVGLGLLATREGDPVGGENPPLPGAAAPHDAEAPPMLRGSDPGSSTGAHDAPPPDVILIGRVLGPDARPAPGAQVRVRSAGREVLRGDTDADGRFELPFGTPPEAEVQVSVLAVSPGPQAGSTSVALDANSHGRLDVGTVFVGAALDLDVQVVAGGVPVPGALVYASSIPITRATPAPFSVARPWAGWSHTTETENEGRAVLSAVPTGALRLLAVADGPLRGERRLRTDLLGGPVVIELQPARDLTIEVVRAGSGDPIPGCRIEAMGPDHLLEEPWASPSTDEEGVAVLRAAPRDPIELRIVGPDWDSAFVAMARRVPAEVTTFRTELPTPTRIVLPIAVRDGSMPPDGTRVVFASTPWEIAPWPQEAVVTQGHVVLDGYASTPTARAIATLPDGRVGYLDLRAHAAPGEAILSKTPLVFHAPRTVEVTVTERGSSRPAVDVGVTLAVSERRPVWRGALRSDASGRVVFEGVPATEGSIRVCSNPDWVSPLRQGVLGPMTPIDTTRGDVALALEVEPMTEAVVEVLTDGRPGFPPGMDVEWFYHPQGMFAVRSSGLALDPEHGELRFRLRRPLAESRPPLHVHGAQQILLAITSDDYAQTFVPLTYDRTLERFTARVDLVRGADLVTRLHSSSPGELQIRLERHEGDRWVRETIPALLAFDGQPADEARYENLRPGRYRLTAPQVGSSSPEVDVAPGPEPTMLTWFLDDVPFAEGTIELPTGVDPEGLQLTAWTVDPPGFGGTASIEGTRFRVPVPKDASRRLVPAHPDCRPAEDDGQVIVTGPEKGLVLRMVAKEP